MKTAMIFPSENSEKAISQYSEKLTQNIRKLNLPIADENYTAGSPPSLFKKLKKIKDYDLIHIQHEYNLLGYFGLPFFYVYFYLWMFKKKKLVTTMHTIPSKLSQFKSGIIKTFLRKYILYPLQNWLINKASDKIIVHAQFFKDILVNEYHVPANKIQIFPQGIIENPPIISKEQAKKQLKLKGNVYLIIGSFIPDHGSDIIVKQANKIGKTILVVVNPNAPNDRNKKRIRDWLDYNHEIVKKNHSESFVRFDVQPVPNSLWWKYISASDLILLPYKGGIGSGIITDSIAAKKPSICSNIQFFQNFADNFNCIKIAKTEEDFPNQIKKAMNPSEYKKMQKECDRYVQEFGLSALGKKYKKFYSSI